MKKMIFSAIMMIAFASSSMAKVKEVKATKTLVTVVNEVKVVKKASDWAGFVCWLFGGHCQPI